MKKYYEISISNRGLHETHVFKNKRAKNKWLVEYLVYGEGSTWGRTAYVKHLKEKALAGKPPVPIERYILNLVKDRLSIILTQQNKIIIIREKFFEKTSKNA